MRSESVEEQLSGGRPASTAVSRAALIGAACALLLVGINMRFAIVAVAPLLSNIQQATGMSHGVAGVFTAIPVLCFGVFAPLAPRIARQLGMETTLVTVLVVLLAGIALRLIPGLVWLFGGTFLIGLSVAIANVVATAMIKRDFRSHHVGLMSGLHTTMLLGGAALAAGLTVPIRDGLGLTWREALGSWGIPAVVAAVVWLPRLRTRSRVPSGPVAHRASVVWKDKLAWNVALFYGFQSVIYYTTTSWLPTFYAAHGLSAEDSGWLLSFLLVTAIISALITPILAGRSARQSYLAIIGSLLCALALTGLWLAPATAAPLTAALLGLGLGAVVSLGITFMSTRAAGHEEAALLSAMSQCVGYLVAAAFPALFGLARDLTGDWNLGLIATLLIALPMAATGIIAGRGGHITTTHSPR
ncbi:MAG TPA: MFS transporter [Pseudonocardia sp.]|jgi:CP family cyanate transporter-like MFS transporter|nr:MFS transporter [Pseudonocardia sp.]